MEKAYFPFSLSLPLPPLEAPTLHLIPRSTIINSTSDFYSALTVIQIFQQKLLQNLNLNPHPDTCVASSLNRPLEKVSDLFFNNCLFLAVYHQLSVISFSRIVKYVHICPRPEGFSPDSPFIRNPAQQFTRYGSLFSPGLKKKKKNHFTNNHPRADYRHTDIYYFAPQHKHNEIHDFTPTAGLDRSSGFHFVLSELSNFRRGNCSTLHS